MRTNNFRKIERSKNAALNTATDVSEVEMSNETKVNPEDDGKSE